MRHVFAASSEKHVSAVISWGSSFQQRDFETSERNGLNHLLISQSASGSCWHHCTGTINDKETHRVRSKFTVKWMNYFKGGWLIKQKTYKLKRQKDFWKVRKLRWCSCGRPVLTGHFIRHTFQISGYLSCCCLSVIWVDIFSFLGNILC